MNNYSRTLISRVCQMAKKIATLPPYKDYLIESSVTDSQLLFKKDAESYFLINFSKNVVYLTDDKKQVQSLSVSTVEASILYDSLCEFLNQSGRYIYRSRIHDFLKEKFGLGIPTPKPQKESEIYLNRSYEYYLSRLETLLLINSKKVPDNEPLYTYEVGNEIAKIYFSKKNQRIFFLREIVGGNALEDPIVGKQKDRDALKYLFESWVSKKRQ